MSFKKSYIMILLQYSRHTNTRTNSPAHHIYIYTYICKIHIYLNINIKIQLLSYRSKALSHSSMNFSMR